MTEVEKKKVAKAIMLLQNAKVYTFLSESIENAPDNDDIRKMMSDKSERYADKAFKILCEVYDVKSEDDLFF